MQRKEGNFERALAALYYYLGILDGMKCYRNALKSLNPTSLPDLVTPWHDLLPPEIHALRHSDANVEAAGNKLAQLFTSTDMSKRLRLMTDGEMRVNTDSACRNLTKE